jgi:hypothetical protein
MTAAPTPTAAPAPAKPRRRRWLVAILGFLAFAALGFFAIKSYLDWRLRADWADAEAEADRLDPGWRFKDMLAKLEPIPDEVNSALLIRELAEGNEYEGFTASAMGFVFYPSPATRLTDAQAKAIETQWNKLRKPIERSRKLKDMPRGRLPLEKGREGPSLLSSQFEEPNVIVDWLHWDALLLAQNGQLKEAAENCVAMFNAGRSLKDELGYNSTRWRVAAQVNAAATLERVLAQGVLSEATLRKLQNVLEEEAAEDLFLQGARRERAHRHLCFEYVRDGEIPAEDLLNPLPGWRGWWLEKFPRSVLQFYPESLRQMNELVEIAKGPSHERAAKLAVFQAALVRSDSPLADYGMLSEDEGIMACQSLLQCAVAAVACERYRALKKTWPANLEVLVKEKYLTRVPLDPYNGAPLRFRATADGIVIYAIGKNGLDEQGELLRHITTASDDQGFRLWDEQHRGQPSGE